MGFRKLSDRTSLGRSRFYYSVSDAQMLPKDGLAQIFGTDLVAWYRADTLVATAGKISEWTDKSGNNNHAVQAVAANQPTLDASGFNGKPVVKFNNLDVWFSMPNCLSATWGQASLFIVYSIKDLTQHWDAMRTGFSNDSYWGTNSVFNYVGYFGEFRNSRIDGQPPNMTVVGNHFLEAVSGMGTNSYKVFRNGSNILTTNPDWGVTTTPTIGKGPDNKRMNGDIAEIFVIKKAATDAQRQSCQDYVKAFWNLTF